MIFFCVFPLIFRFLPADSLPFLLCCVPLHKLTGIAFPLMVGHCWVSVVVPPPRSLIYSSNWVAASSTMMARCWVATSWVESCQCNRNTLENHRSGSVTATVIQSRMRTPMALRQRWSCPGLVHHITSGKVTDYVWTRQFMDQYSLVNFICTVLIHRSSIKTQLTAFFSLCKIFKR